MRAQRRPEGSDPLNHHGDSSPGCSASLREAPFVPLAGGHGIPDERRSETSFGSEWRTSPDMNHPHLGRFICLKEGAGFAGPLLQTDNSNHMGEVNRVRGRNVMGSFGRLRELLGSRRAGTSGDELLELGGEVTDVEYIVVAEQHRTFHGVPQLSNVSRPSVGLKCIDGPRRDAGDGIRGAGVDLSDERPDESGDVGGTLAEGG